MPKKSLCFRILKRQAQEALSLANRLNIIDRDLALERDERFIYIPLVHQPSVEELRIFADSRIESQVFDRVFQGRMRRASPAEMLEDRIPPHLLASLPRSADLVGDIAIIEIPAELNFYRRIIGEAFLLANRNLRTVLAKAGAVAGTHRVRELVQVAGETKTETVHKEYGCQYCVDVAKAYFSPRLSGEHHRVASLVKEGETVVDLFAGVGPFAVQIAKTHKNVKVYAVDINPYAVEFLDRNVRLNRVYGEVIPMLGDAREIVGKCLKGIADRVIMNLPEKAMEFVDVGCEALKPDGGIMHFYCFVDQSNPIEKMKLRFAEIVRESGRRASDFASTRHVRDTAPHEWQAVIDAEIL